MEGKLISFRFDPGRELADEIGRVLAEQFAGCCAHLSSDLRRRSEAIHEARKATKRIRAVLQLVSSPAGRKLLVAVRDAARILSVARDADAVLEAADRLLIRHSTLLSAPEEHELKTLLCLPSQAEASRMGAGVAECMAAASAGLREASSSVPGLIPDRARPGGFSLIAPGVQRSWRGFRDALHAARRHSEDSRVLHEWRKRVKEHACHLRLLEPSFPGELRPRRRLLERMGEQLGEEHDLSALIRIVEEAAPPFGPRVVSIARGDATRFATDALDVGAKLAVERPKPLVARLRGFYEAEAKARSHPSKAPGNR